MVSHYNVTTNFEDGQLGVFESENRRLLKVNFSLYLATASFNKPPC